MLSLAFAGPVPTETGKIALSFTYAIHVVSSWGVLFWSCGPCLLDMGRFEFVMGRFGFGHGAFCRLTGRGSVPAARACAMPWGRTGMAREQSWRRQQVCNAGHECAWIPFA